MGKIEIQVDLSEDIIKYLQLAAQLRKETFSELCTKYLKCGLSQGKKDLGLAIKYGIAQDKETYNLVKEIKGLTELVSGPIPSHKECCEKLDKRLPNVGEEEKRLIEKITKEVSGN